MIIDFHRHPYRNVKDDLQNEGIDAAVLLPVGDKADRMAQDLATKFPDTFIPFCWLGYLNEMDTAKERLENAIKTGAKGIKFQPLLQHFFPDEKRMYPIYEQCVEHDMVALFHTGMVAFREEFGIPHFARYAYTIPGIDQIAADFPSLKIVICHMGGNYSYEALVTAEKHENIFMDTAYLGFFGPRSLPELQPIEFISRGVRFLGKERILFGSEGISPQLISESDLSEQEKEQILGLNAMRLLGIKE